ncbi:MAG: hypothetical protein ACXADY_23820 [Candidatus Hodarchaeales archaeon]|jgi:hypothetical protein
MIWREVIKNAEKLSGNQEQLAYLIDNQPDLPLRGRIKKTSLILKPDGLSWWLANADKHRYDFHFLPDELGRETEREDKWLAEAEKHRHFFSDIESAVADGISLEDAVLGFYIAQPWSWMDQHTFWGEQDRAKDLADWIKERKC